MSQNISAKVMQSSEKLQKTQELHLQLYKPQLNVKVQKKTEQLWGAWKGCVVREKVSEETRLEQKLTSGWQ